VAYLPGEGLVEKLHTVALHQLEKTEERARDAEQQIIEKRRARILPRADELQKIARYEAHLSREMFRSLHELEALQTRRAGGTIPLGRLDVSS
jgi:vacuolar-type H+-ATPase subunit E/Vma4